LDINQDFKDLLALFNEQEVDYIIVGGYALAFHGAPRFTGDIDLWIRPTEENAEHILQALKMFGFGSLGIDSEDLTRDDQVIQLGYPPARVDLMTTVDGISFDSSFSNSVETHYGDITVKMISKDDLITNKRAIGRHKDFADIEALGGTVD